jgi:hypothetical protein
MRVHQQKQLNRVSDEVLALTAVVRPILKGVLYSIKADIVREAGGYKNVKLKLLPRLRRESDGDCGVCFEYAVHEAMLNRDSRVVERIADAALLCNVPGQNVTSILFGLEKSGALQLIRTAHDLLTDDSRLLYGTKGQPAKLRNHLKILTGAFKNKRTRPALPSSIRGLWKADLFVGFVDTDRWVGTSVKINPSHLEGAAGLRIGIVPARQGASDAVRRDDSKNLVICPLHHDGDFMQIFYEGWRIVQAFLTADAKVPKEVLLPRPVDREVAKILAERRDFPVLEVIDAIAAFGQPELLHTDDTQVEMQNLEGHAATDTLVAPISLSVK